MQTARPVAWAAALFALALAAPYTLGARTVRTQARSFVLLLHLFSLLYVSHQPLGFIPGSFVPSAVSAFVRPWVPVISVGRSGGCTACPTLSRALCLAHVGHVSPLAMWRFPRQVSVTTARRLC